MVFRGLPRACWEFFFPSCSWVVGRECMLEEGDALGPSEPGHDLLADPGPSSPAPKIMIPVPTNAECPSAAACAITGYAAAHHATQAASCGTPRAMHAPTNK